MPEGVPINGKVLVELRRLAGMDQVDLANACCVQTPGCCLSAQHISAYERGVKRPGAGNLAAILRALKRGWEENGLELREVEQRALIRTPTLDAATSNGSAVEEDDADRRTAGKILAVGSLTAALTPSAALERIAAHMASADYRADSKLITAHEDLTDALARLDQIERPDVLLSLVAQETGVVLRLLGRDLREGQRRRLEVAAVGSCAQAGFLTFRLGDRTNAGRLFARARSVAESTGDGTLCAQALGAASILYSSLPSGRGDTPRAVTLMQTAAAHARSADAPTRAWVGWWLAMELAAAGDEQGFHKTIEVAGRMSERGSHTDSRGFFARFFATPEPEEIAGNIGAGLVLLGHPADGIELLETSLIPAWPRWTVARLTDVATARVLQGEPEQACQELARAIDLAIDTGYPMGVERIRGVRARFPEPWKSMDCVSVLDERLSEQ